MTDLYKHKKTMYLTSGMRNSPKLLNEYGSLNSLLKILLTEGFNITQVVDATSDLLNNTVTLILNLNHGFRFNDVIELYGSSQEGLNGNYRIIDSKGTSITIKMYPSFKESTITFPEELTIKIAPLGYTIPYENEEEGVICFKNKSLKSPAILKSIDKLPPNGYADSWAKYSRVVIGQEIDSSGNFKSNFKAPYWPKYPDVEKTGDGVTGAPGIHGFAKWDYAIYTASYDTTEHNSAKGEYPTDWKIVGDDISFYLMIRAQGKAKYSYNLLGFGNYISENLNETTNVCLQARDGSFSSNSSTGNNYSRTKNDFGVLGASNGGFILANIQGDYSSKYGYYSCQGLYLGSNNSARPWSATDINSYNISSGKITTSPIFIKDYENYLRGYHRGIKLFYGTGQLSEGSLSSNGDLILYVQTPLTSSSYETMPLLFSLKDWENVE